MLRNLPEELACHVLLAPQVDGSLTSLPISLKNANKAWIKCVVAQGAVAQQADFTLRQATDIAIGTNAAIVNNVPIWYNENYSASAETLTRGTAAKAYTFDANQSRTKICWFEIDPANVFTDGYDVIYVVCGGSNVANIISVEAFIEPKTKAATLETFLVD